MKIGGILLTASIDAMPPAITAHRCLQLSPLPHRIVPCMRRLSGCLPPRRCIQEDESLGGGQWIDELSLRDDLCPAVFEVERDLMCRQSRHICTGEYTWTPVEDNRVDTFI